MKQRRLFSKDERWTLFAVQFGVCAICNKELEEHSFHADHIVPFSKGGKTEISNGQAVCQLCNLSKGAKYVQ